LHDVQYLHGVDLFTIARQVGHTDLRQIEQRYGHLLAEHRKKAVRAIDGMFAPAESRNYIAPGAKIVE
jgi:integrase